MIYIITFIIFKNDSPETYVLVVQLFGVQLYLINIFKIAHAYPRPFWISKGKLKLDGKCSAQFGNPSGHAFCAVFFSMFLFFTHVWPLKRTAQNMIFMVFSFIILTLGWLSMSYSRFILGLHSSGQLIYGGLLGAWSLFLCLKYINPRIKAAITATRQNGFGPESKKYMICIGAICFAELVSIIVAHAVIDSQGKYQFD